MEICPRCPPRHIQPRLARIVRITSQYLASQGTVLRWRVYLEPTFLHVYHDFLSGEIVVFEDYAAAD